MRNVPPRRGAAPPPSGERQSSSPGRGARNAAVFALLRATWARVGGRARCPPGAHPLHAHGGRL
eukprot:9489932-Pyramimonas_sp.AAC.1